MATRKNTVARFKVGNLTYCRYVKGGDTYATVEGYEYEDSEYTWKVKVDKKTNKRYYISMGGYGKRWLLPEKYPPGGGQSSVNASSSSSLSAAPIPPSPLTPILEKETDDDGTTISLIDLYKQRVAFNPGEQSFELPTELIDLMTTQLTTIGKELSLPPESILSIILSAGYYLKTRIRHQGSSIYQLIPSTVQKLAYAVAADVKANVASSPFVECYTKITYLSSINESISGIVEEQAADIEIIKRNIELRKAERKRAGNKLLTWKNRCAEVDKEVLEAASEGSAIANSVAEYLANIRAINDVVQVKFPSDALTCTAQIERLNAQLQEGCQQSRSLQGSYKRLKQSRESLRSSLDTLSSENCDCSDRTDSGSPAAFVSKANSDSLLLEQLAMQREENERLKARLAAAEQIIHDNEFRQRAESEVRDQEIEALKRASLHKKAKVVPKAVQTDVDESAAVEGTIISEGDRQSILDIIHQHKQLVETLSLTQEKGDAHELSQSQMLQTCLTAAHNKIKSQREQIRELKSLLSVTLDLKDSADDPVRALINATSPLHMRFEQETSDPVLLDISPIGVSRQDV
eukprot:TRINITY_DN2293_c0_g1_i1.p1 TRINITY_DN2293_c0_g1~~TRINITY_DN2293_c0_g1_i1.p1  ORF type:complete len:590 (+),score=128.19 TRINITY_DN2293_c0_g1_i1:42-1772(+)